MQADGLISSTLTVFFLFFQTHSPTLDWQGPVVCHLLSMFGTGACTSCFKALLLGTPLITHSDWPIMQTAYHSHWFNILFTSPVCYTYFTSSASQSWHINLLRKTKLLLKSFSSKVYSRSDSQSLGNAKKRKKKGFWIVFESRMSNC